jgi:hypothetical protein
MALLHLEADSDGSAGLRRDAVLDPGEPTRLDARAVERARTTQTKALGARLRVERVHPGLEGVTWQLCPEAA